MSRSLQAKHHLCRFRKRVGALFLLLRTRFSSLSNSSYFFSGIKCCWTGSPIQPLLLYGFHTPVSRRAVLCDWKWRAAGGGRRVAGGVRPHRFPHNNFGYVYRIFTKHGHMIPLWKGKNPIYFGVIRSKGKVTVTINIIFDNRVVSA